MVDGNIGRRKRGERLGKVKAILSAAQQKLKHEYDANKIESKIYQEALGTR